MMYNSYDYNPIYNEHILGAPEVCKVKDLPKIRPKRAGAIIYYENVEKKEVKPLETVELKREYSYGNVKILKREDTLVNYKPKLIQEEKISFRINEVNPNTIDNITLQGNIPKVDRVYALGVDSQFGTLTDFAGGVKYKYDKDPVSAALRELREESLLLFNFEKKDVQDCYCIYNREILIIFICIKIPLEICACFFETLVSKEPNPEVSKIKWFSEKELIETITRPYIVYEPVRSLLNETIISLINNINLYT